MLTSKSFRLVSIGQGEPPSPRYFENKMERLKEKWPDTPDPETLGVDPAARPETIDKAEIDPPNLGPSTGDHTPQRFGLLDFQDIALFLWPPYRERECPFTTDEQCLVLRHRNARLTDLTQVELVEVQAWMERSETIAVEGTGVNLRKWRINLDEKKFQGLAKRMEEDLTRARSISTYTKPTPPKTSSEKRPVEMATPPTTPPRGIVARMNRSQRLAAKRRIEDDSE